MLAFAGISTSLPLSQTDLARPPPAPNAVPRAAPRPTSPPAKAPNTKPESAPAAEPAAKSFVYSLVTSSFVPPTNTPVESFVFITAEIGI